MAFVVRVAVGETPELCGTVERVRTGERHRFQGLETLGRLLAQMVGPAPPEPDAHSGERT